MLYKQRKFQSSSPNLRSVTRHEKCPKYRLISGPHFPIFGLNTGKYGPEITPYLDTFYAVSGSGSTIFSSFSDKCLNFVGQHFDRDRKLKDEFSLTNTEKFELLQIIHALPK